MEGPGGNRIMLLPEEGVVADFVWLVTHSSETVAYRLWVGQMVIWVALVVSG